MRRKGRKETQRKLKPHLPYKKRDISFALRFFAAFASLRFIHTLKVGLFFIPAL